MSKNARNWSKELRQFILNMEHPFCWVDLKYEALKAGIPKSKIELLSKVLDDMYREGVVCYDKIPPEQQKEGCSDYAFYVA
ncbi:hypothetical protein IK110_04565 [Candidatus Saccharibacteria bacterium]|nr:hypothetical protein [Candidatus Saccharibacteria bacterium]